MQVGGEQTVAGALFINTWHFWIISAASVLLLRVLTNGRLRQYAWAGINLLFLAVVVGKYLAWVLIAGAVLFFLFRAYSRFKNKFVLTAGIVGTGLLLFFAYKTTFLQRPSTLPIKQLLAAIGYSFVYLRIIDIARALQDGRHEPPHAVDLVNYLVPFHMIAAGPIQAYDDFVRQPKIPQPLTRRGTLEALERVSAGLFKKFVLAYALQKVFLTDLQAPGIWFLIEIQVLLLWLHLDFSAYSDIAVGLGRLMGVATPENFDQPWKSRNMVEFWDRWHISLSQWIRRNLSHPDTAQLDAATPASRSRNHRFIRYRMRVLHGRDLAWRFRGLVIVGPHACLWVSHRPALHGMAAKATNSGTDANLPAELCFVAFGEGLHARICSPCFCCCLHRQMI